MDALPKAKAGFEEDTYPPKHKKQMYFDNIVTPSFRRIQMHLAEVNEQEQFLLYKNDTQICIYFYNTSFPKCTEYQKNVIKFASAIYLKAMTPDKVILSMISKKLPVTIYIYHIPLFYRFGEKHPHLFDFSEKTEDTTLTTFLLMHYVHPIQYIWIHDTDVLEKFYSNKMLTNLKYKLIPVSNLLEYHYLELEESNKDIQFKHV
jgi:hypothetical protein